MIESVKYTDILEKMPNFLSLDISVKSTGWVEWYNKKLTYGCYHIESQTNRQRREEYSKFLRGLIKDKHYEAIYVEDCIGGENYATNRILIELNVIVEDLMMYGFIPESPVERQLASVWENKLKLLSMRNPLPLLKPKEMTQLLLNDLGFKVSEVEAKAVGGTKKDSNQDIYDAMGMAIATTLKDTKSNNVTKISKLHVDLSKGYKITQYITKAAMLEAALRKQKRARSTRNIKILDYDNKYKNMQLQFREHILESNNDKDYYCVTTPLNKVGAMAITKDFDISKDEVYFMVERR